MIAGKDNAPKLSGGGGVEVQIKRDGADSASWSHGRQALRIIEGEQKARAYLERLQAQRVDVDELAATVAMLRDAVSLAGFCRVIEKALGVRHG